MAPQSTAVALLSLALAVRAQVPPVSLSGDVTFSPFDVSGALEVDEDGLSAEVDVSPNAPSPTSGPALSVAPTERTGTLIRLCGCPNTAFDFQPAGVANIRGISDEFMANGTAESTLGHSNFVWAWGQFLDHDLVKGVDDGEGAEFEITLTQDGAPTTAAMTLHRLVVEGADDGVCRMPVTTNTPLVDAGPVYSPSEAFLNMTLREPDSCRLRQSAGELLPVTTAREGPMLMYLLIAGDGRVNEHGVLASMHTIFVREHNRLCEDIAGNADFEGLSADEQFNKARQIVVAKFQHITLTQYLPAIGISEDSVRSATPMVDTPDVSVEFMISYRYGHDIIPDAIGDYDVVDLFGGEAFFGIDSPDGSADPEAANARLDNLLTAAGEELATAIDGRFADVLRDTLFGEFGEDLASRNLFRGREVGVAGYSATAECFGVTPNAEVAASADDAFLGLLQEGPAAGDPGFGPTILAIFAEQFHRAFFGAGGSYWEDDEAHLAAVSGYEDEIRNSSLAAVVNANSGARVAGDGMFAMAAPPASPDTESGSIAGVDIEIENPTGENGAAAARVAAAAAVAALAAALAA